MDCHILEVSVLFTGEKGGRDKVLDHKKENRVKNITKIV